MSVGKNRAVTIWSCGRSLEGNIDGSAVCWHEFVRFMCEGRRYRLDIGMMTSGESLAYVLRTDPQYGATEIIWRGRTAELKRTDLIERAKLEIAAYLERIEGKAA